MNYKYGFYLHNLSTFKISPYFLANFTVPRLTVFHSDNLLIYA